MKATRNSVGCFVGSLPTVEVGDAASTCVEPRGGPKSTLSSAPHATAAAPQRAPSVNSQTASQLRRVDTPRLTLVYLPVQAKTETSSSEKPSQRARTGGSGR